MKILIVVLFLPLYSFSQSLLPLNDEKKIEYTDVVVVDSMKAEKLAEDAKVFINKVFRNGKEVTQFTDDRNNSLMAKGFMPVKVAMFMGKSVLGEVWFTMLIQCKDNRYKYTISDFVFKYQPGTMTKRYEDPLEEEKSKAVTDKQWQSIKQQVDEMVREVIRDMKSAISNNNSDW